MAERPDESSPLLRLLPPPPDSVRAMNVFIRDCALGESIAPAFPSSLDQQVFNFRGDVLVTPNILSASAPVPYSAITMIDNVNGELVIQKKGTPSHMRILLKIKFLLCYIIFLMCTAVALAMGEWLLMWFISLIVVSSRSCSLETSNLSQCFDSWTLMALPSSTSKYRVATTGVSTVVLTVALFYITRLGGRLCERVWIFRRQLHEKVHWLPWPTGLDDIFAGLSPSTEHDFTEARKVYISCGRRPFLKKQFIKYGKKLAPWSNMWAKPERKFYVSMRKATDVEVCRLPASEDLTKEEAMYLAKLILSHYSQLAGGHHQAC